MRIRGFQAPETNSPAVRAFTSVDDRGPGTLHVALGPVPGRQFEFLERGSGAGPVRAAPLPSGGRRDAEGGTRLGRWSRAQRRKSQGVLNANGRARQAS